MAYWGNGCGVRARLLPERRGGSSPPGPSATGAATATRRWTPADQGHDHPARQPGHSRTGVQLHRSAAADAVHAVVGEPDLGDQAQLWPRRGPADPPSGLRHHLPESWYFTRYDHLSSSGACGTALLVVIGVTIVTFILLHLLPGGPARAILGPRATPAAIAVFNRVNGFDQPMLVQYLGLDRPPGAREPRLLLQAQPERGQPHRRPAAQDHSAGRAGQPGRADHRGSARGCCRPAGATRRSTTP